MHMVCSEVKTERGGGMGLVFLGSCESGGGVESRSGLDQNTSWVIVEIPPEKILLRQIV